MFRKVCSFTIVLLNNRRIAGSPDRRIDGRRPIRFYDSTMEQLHDDSTSPGNDHAPNEESLSEYVKRMETPGNLKKLAQKLKADLKYPNAENVPDLSFEKFEEKRTQQDRQ